MELAIALIGALATVIPLLVKIWGNRVTQAQLEDQRKQTAFDKLTELDTDELEKQLRKRELESSGTVGGMPASANPTGMLSK